MNVLRSVENTVCARPLTNVGTAPAGSGAGAGAANDEFAFSVIFGGIGTADALLAPTTVAMALAATAVARSLVLKTLLPSRACLPAVAAQSSPANRRSATFWR
jgi:hypothetical protein